MTFIASVVAKKGVAVIADSLVTSQSHVLYYKKFIEYVEQQPTNDQGERLVNPDSIQTLFNSEPVFTKDFEEKLFEFDSYTALTTTGQAYVNEKNIADIVEEFRRSNDETIKDLQTPIESKIDIFKVIIYPTDSGALSNEAHDYITLSKEADWARVVCDGQNKISERVLY